MINSIALIICAYIVYIASVRITNYLKKILSEINSIKGLLSSIEFNYSDNTKPYIFEDNTTDSFDIDSFELDYYYPEDEKTLEK